MTEPVDEDDDWWKGGGAAPDADFDDEHADDYGDDESTIPCPHCGTDVFDDAEQCPSCGEWLVGDRRPTTGRTGWFFLLGLVLAALVLLSWIVGH